MARISEIPLVWRKIGPWQFVKNLYREIQDDGVMTIAAAVSYYWFFAFFPLMIFLIALIPMLPEKYREQATNNIEIQLKANIPGQAEAITNQIREFLNTPKPGVMSVGMLLMLFAASNGMNQTMLALDRCYDVNRPRNFLLQRSVAILMTLAFILMALLIVLVIPIGNLALRWVDNLVVSEGGTESITTMPSFALVARIAPYWAVVKYFIALSMLALLVNALFDLRSRSSDDSRRRLLGYAKLAAAVIGLMMTLVEPIGAKTGELLHSFSWLVWRPALDVARYFMGFTLLVLLVSTIYQFGATVRRRWVLITPGAVVCVAVILACGWGFSWYVENFGAKSYQRTYGAVGGIIILLLMFYLYAVAFLIGAEINSEIDFAVVGVRSDQITDATNVDPLPELHDSNPKYLADLERFRRQLAKRRVV
jgi:YihY family inner membrane protein